MILVSTVFPSALSLLEQIIRIARTMRCRSLVVSLKGNVKRCLVLAGTWVARRLEGGCDDIASYEVGHLLNEFSPTTANLTTLPES